MIFRAWDRVSLRGFSAGFIQVRFWVRVVSSVANCVVVSPVVRWCGNGSSWCGLSVCLVIYSQGCLLGGAVV